MEILKKDDFLPQILMQFMPPTLPPIRTGGGLLSNFFDKMKSECMAVVAENHARIYKANTNKFMAQVEMMRAMQTYSSDLEIYFANNQNRLAELKHNEIMWKHDEDIHQLEVVEKNAKVRTALAEAEKAELELQQYKRLLNDSET